MSIIEFKNISFSYESLQVLKDISFKIDAGDYIGIIGPNGGGKTTAVKLLLGLLSQNSGTIESSISKSQIGYVPQRASQNLSNFPATVDEIVASGAKLGTSGKQIKAATEKALKTAGIQKLRSKLISRLSGGELQKVFVARALVSEPKVLVLDEPIVGIDTPSQEKFYDFLYKLNQKQGITILFISHDLDIITKYVNKVFCLNKTLIIHDVDCKDGCHGHEHLLDSDSLAHIYGANSKIIHHHH